MLRRVAAIAIIAALTSVGVRPAAAAVNANPVDCWVENLTPTVQVGAWADYVVHMSGGLGSYSVAFSYGDGHQDQGTYSASSASFSHLFWASGTYVQTATVSGAGSQAACGTSTSVY